MRKCNKCNIKVISTESNCPLCHKKLSDRKNKSIVDYPKYNNIKTKKKNIPLFITIFSIIILTYINIFNHNKGNILWSGVASISILYVFIEYIIIKKNWNYGSKLFYSYLLLSTLLIALDFFCGVLLWSTNYVFPFLTAGIVCKLTILAIINKHFFIEYFGYILAAGLCSIIPVILYFLGVNNHPWGSFVAFLTIIITATALYLFTDITLKKELKKRFHIK